MFSVENKDTTTQYTPSESRAEKLCITTEQIEKIVSVFYAKIQQDEILGPIFEKEMTEDWDHHLVKMNSFWATVMFGKGSYKGNPLLVHGKIQQLTKAHFDHWLCLFESTLKEVCTNSEQVEDFLNRARRMAVVLNAGRN